MMPLRRVRVCGYCLWLTSSLLVTGCAMGRSSVSMDSNSPSPWMNLEFLPSRKKADVKNYHRSIAEQRPDGESAAEITPAVTEKKKESRLASWLLPGSERTPLPLPRSDIQNPQTAASEARPDWWGFE